MTHFIFELAMPHPVCSSYTLRILVFQLFSSCVLSNQNNELTYCGIWFVIAQNIPVLAEIDMENVHEISSLSPSFNIKQHSKPH